MENKDPAVGNVSCRVSFLPMGNLGGSFSGVKSNKRQGPEMQKCSRNEKQDACWHRVVCKREMNLEKLD